MNERRCILVCLFLRGDHRVVIVLDDGRLVSGSLNTEGLPDLGISSRVAGAALASVFLTLTTFALVAVCAVFLRATRRWSRW